MNYYAYFYIRVDVDDLALVPSSERKRLSSQGCSAINLEEGNKLVVHTLETFIQVTIQQFSDQFMFVVSLSAFWHWLPLLVFENLQHEVFAKLQIKICHIQPTWYITYLHSSFYNENKNSISPRRLKEVWTDRRTFTLIFCTNQSKASLFWHLTQKAEKVSTKQVQRKWPCYCFSLPTVQELLEFVSYPCYT